MVAGYVILYLKRKCNNKILIKRYPGDVIMPFYVIEYVFSFYGIGLPR